MKAIIRYYRKEASAQVARNITTSIQREAQRLLLMPQIGVIEPLLATKSREYRYIISSHYKIIYCHRLYLRLPSRPRQTRTIYKTNINEYELRICKSCRRRAAYTGSGLFL
ncbi:type II toxin-antitoxin system RelE/ParE family toxin [Parabacteroides johnsonii]|uniref:type II toxin-antitoxin system RelE/ParE family toxin n=1 Tax=Parabacteroides johnsonii TaxID=387661 RepID=UPI001E304E98|nr:type II toxin-antitoxin system RelE/ParE family toxin [Parabacteroides johnsonii]